MIITICSSVDFSPKIIEIKKELENKGHKVNIPYFTQKIIDGEVSYEEYMNSKEKAGGDIQLRKAQSTDMIKRYWDFIKNSDAILVLNLNKKGIDNYIGGSVLMEMGFAHVLGKKIFLLNPIPKMSYTDEIIAMKPVVINNDLSELK